MTSVILHVGPHKTGTTYLQRCFSYHRATLATRGVIVPSVWDESPENASHTGIVHAVSGRGDLVEAATVVTRVFSDADKDTTLLISAEDISTLDPDALMRLRNMFIGHNLTVVYYIRRWSDLLPSAYQEQVKHGKIFSFPEFMAIRLCNPEGFAFNYEIKLDKLFNTFGRENLRLVSYSALQDSKQNLFVHFANRFLDWKDAEPPPGEIRPNTSLHITRVEIIRRLNNISADLGRKPFAAMMTLNRLEKSFDVKSIVDSMEPSKRVLSFSDSSRTLHRLHKELRQRLAANLVQPCPTDLIFAPRNRDIAYIGDEYLLRPGVVEAFQALHQGLISPEPTPRNG